MTLKIGISRSNLISSRSEDFRVFFYVIWWTEYEKNHSGILDFENLQSRSHLIFGITESWRWLSSVRIFLDIPGDAAVACRVCGRKEIWPLNRGFQGQGCLWEFFNYFFHIQRMKLHRNTLSNLYDKWDKFFTLHFTLPAGLVDISTSCQFGDSTWDIQWFYI